MSSCGQRSVHSDALPQLIDVRSRGAGDDQLAGAPLDEVGIGHEDAAAGGSGVLEETV
jgi:hypothetical protein